MHGTSANVAELPVPLAWEQQLTANFEAGKREAREEHADHLRKSEKDRYRHHRKWTIIGTIALLGAMLWLNLLEGHLFPTNQRLFDNLFWAVVGFLVYFTYNHDKKRAFYLKQISFHH